MNTTTSGKMALGRKIAEFQEGVSDGQLQPASPHLQLCFQSPLKQHQLLYKSGISNLVKELVPDLPGKKGTSLQ